MRNCRLCVTLFRETLIYSTIVIPTRCTWPTVGALGDVQVVALAHPCASRHSGILPIAAGRQEKVRPGTGREAGLGHAGSDQGGIHRVSRKFMPVNLRAP